MAEAKLMTIERDVVAVMRDGVHLATDIYRPADAGPLPVLLCRTPYDKTNAGLSANARQLAKRGYVVAVQDIRGRYASDGVFQWNHLPEGWDREGEDGYDSVEWAAGIEGSDGRVGTFGHSYEAWLSWRVAGMQPPSLAGAIASGISVRHTDTNYGIMEIGRRLQWMYAQAADARRRTGDIFGPHKGKQAGELWHRMERGKWLWHVPLDTIPDDVFSTLTPLVRHWYRNQHVDPWGFDRLHPLIKVPTCTVTGWWDRFSDAVDHFTGMEKNGPQELRGRHRLVVGPWNHGLDTPTGRTKAIGPNGAYEPIEANAYPQLVADFFDPLLKGSGREQAPARLFIVNRNDWMETTQWPPEGAAPVPLYLGGGKANTPLGDGRLTFDPPGDDASATPDTYVYDPADPAMSLMTLDAQAGQNDQAPNGRRRDILVFQTPPLERDLLAVGPAHCTLWVASDGVETDFTAKLIEVTPEGVASNISYGILRTRFMEGYDKVARLVPNEPTRIEIRLKPCGILFRKGSRIRLDISSSDFPAFDRNHNTGREFWADAELRPARQTVFHDSSRPSSLTLHLLKAD